ncbi:hypothetical protein K7X08_014416 [Anisodus acutangulus]|uniref:Uncharacterized protein n=1 Tax=Anisodus acutangulus TaxID=402998 RepID=A0A9Q1LL57_9SOLA|nr:hypothetical protein K7X08_014416 [Anisodus acutangulus]
MWNKKVDSILPKKSESQWIVTTREFNDVVPVSDSSDEGLRIDDWTELRWRICADCIDRYALTRNHNHPTQHINQPRHHTDELCRGGICWHGVAVRSPASQVRFRLPQHYPR